MVTWRGPSATWPVPVRGWVRRPDGLRVETLDGDVVHADLRAVTWGTTRGALTTDGRGEHVTPRPPLDPLAPRPEIDADGLVSRRPPDDGRIFYGDPMFQNYSWVAMLDPVELADVGRGGSGPPPSAPLEIDSVTEADHLGRPSWEAVVRPTASYDPLCGCCALLFSANILEAGLRPNEAWLDPGFRFPDAHHVRLDVATGVCVLTEELGGSRAGFGHDLAIEAVDETMNDHLFLSQRR